MLWATKRRRARRPRCRDQVAGALAADPVVGVVDALLARVELGRQRGQLVDDDLGAGGGDRRVQRRRRRRRRRSAASAPSARIRSAARSRRVIPVTSCPAATSAGTSGRPIAPLAPATKILIERLYQRVGVDIVVAEFRRGRRRRREREQDSEAVRGVLASPSHSSLPCVVATAASAKKATLKVATSQKQTLQARRPSGQGQGPEAGKKGKVKIKATLLDLRPAGR